ncbi:MAG: translocation/assembly module TamB domain-containing protein, partial [Atribacterota bacterium]|nr:translocation/assembly module TamB domain-containing protein [Atribacterota bacterium]
EGNISFAETARFAINIKYQTPEISNLINVLAFDQKIAGSAEIEAAITGNASNPDIIAEFRLQELSFQEYYLGNLNGILSLQNNIISLQDFSIKNQELNLTSSGNINLNTIDAPEVDLVYQLESINIENLGQIFTFSTPLSGSTSGNGIIQGIWPVLTLSGNFLLEEILYDNYPLGNGRANFILQPEKSILYPVESEDSLSALLNINGYTYSLLLEELDLKNEMMELLVYGKIKIGEDFQFSGETEFSSEYIIDLVESFYPLEDNSLKEFLPSNINGRVAFSGDKDKQQMELSLQILPQIPDSSLASEIEAEIVYQEQRFFISDFRFIQPAGQLRAEGSIGLDQVLDINFQAEQLDIKTLLQLIDTQETANGIMDIEGTLKGILTQPEILIVARMQEGDFREFKFVDLHADFYWNSQNRNLEVRDFILSLEEEYQIVAQGNLPLDSFFIEDRVSAIPSSGLDFPLDFQIKMEQADLNILNLFWKDIFANYTGNIDLNLSLTGTSSMPLLNGYIDIQEGGLSLKDFPVKLEQVDTRIEINDNEVIILPIPLTAFENQFTLEGHFEFISFYPENISISIKNIQQKISFQNIIESEIIFTAETKGSWPALEIESQLYLTNGHLNLNQLQAFNLDELIPESQDRQSPALPVQLDMNIVIADPFTLRLPNAEIYITGNALLTGQLDDPAIQGNINLRRGSLVYLERQFNITEGRAAINGFTVNDININARAETMVQDVLIMIDVSGNLAQPQVRLSSQPVMLETEIISLLTLGRNIEGLSEGELNQLLSQELIEILFQSIQINLLRQIESGLAQQLGLDFLRLSTENLFSDDDSIFLFEKMNLSSLKLEVGKNISDDFFISYTTPLDFQGEKIISIDYQVSSDLSLNTQFEGFSINDSDYRFKFGLNLRF